MYSLFVDQTCCRHSAINLCTTTVVWSGMHAVQKTKLEKLQERALRFVYLDTDSNYNELLDRADIATLHLGRLRMLATEVYKSKITTHNLRAQNNLHIPRVNLTTCGLHSSSYLGAKICNELNNRI